LAHALEHDFAAVEQETLLCVPGDLADAEAGEFLIDQGVATVDAGADGVEVGRFDVPAFWLFDFKG